MGLLRGMMETQTERNMENGMAIAITLAVLKLMQHSGAPKP